MRLGILAVLAGAVIFSVRFLSVSFTTDDAYITFRYARNIAQGHGPVFNPGERVEGYTNPLWTYLLACGIRLGLAPQVLAQALGWASGVGVLASSWWLAAQLAGWSAWAGLVPLSLATSRDLVAWSSSGLEMGLFTLLVVLTLARSLHESRAGGPPLSAWLSALAALTRPEGLLWVGVGWWVRGQNKRWIALAVTLLLPFFAFRLLYYRALVPNTYFLKAGLHLSRGVFYVGEFLRTHPGAPLWAAGAALALDIPLRVVGAGLATHLLYLIAVGGDFMEFRFMLPPLVVSVALVPAFLRLLRPHLALGLGATAALGVGWTSLVPYVERESPYMIEGVEELREAAREWEEFGAFLGSIADPGDLIAVGPAGAIPYHSALPTVDMLGLNDPWVARHGDVSTRAAGHERVAPWSYLASRHVVWVVGQPKVARHPSPAPEEISVRMPSSRWMILRTTLDADSLRAVLASRGAVVAPVDRASTDQRGEHAAARLLEAWRLFGRGELETASAIAAEVIDAARPLGASWRWLLREAGFLHRACSAGGRGPEREKRWEDIPDPIPDRWRARFDDARRLVGSPR